ncbi:ClpP/crotonase-like domain-containing protein [Obelidium mucronatum]|nr:ClpP/crotonase-like domain-containing protein [Obelidium mucronatum]
MTTSNLPTYETLMLSTPSPDVIHVQLNRPQKLNAMSKQMWRDISSCFTAISVTTSIRAVVLSGSGRGFTAGLDLFDFVNAFKTSGDCARNALEFLELVKWMQESITAVEKCRQPVIAAVHGPCVGGGIDLITACDIRYASKDALFSVKEVDIGLAADVGTLQRLPKVVGNQSWVHEICLTGRNFSSMEAETYQLISRVVDGSRDEVVAAALKTAELIASKSPVAVVGTKNVLKYSRDHSVEEGLRYVGLWNASMIQTEDTTIAATASMSKSKAVYSKL